LQDGEGREDPGGRVEPVDGVQPDDAELRPVQDRDRVGEDADAPQRPRDGGGPAVIRAFLGRLGGLHG
jgi:hypothetical protein